MINQIASQEILIVLIDLALIKIASQVIQIVLMDLIQRVQKLVSQGIQDIQIVVMQISMMTTTKSASLEKIALINTSQRLRQLKVVVEVFLLVSVRFQNQIMVKRTKNCIHLLNLFNRRPLFN
jgi:hypothetical protein